MSIRQLPEHVVDRIKSSIVVTTLTGVASGLLKNAFDAQATKVNITVDFAKGNCTVEDNGHGISPVEFAIDGGLGKLHHTSRFPPSPDTHGRHGDFLASLCTLSLLSLTSHHHRHISHNSITIHNGKVLTRQLPSLLEQRFESFDHGTRVVVRDLFGSMPVRVKHRATLFAESSAIDKEFGRLVREVTILLLAWPGDVTIMLRESSTKRELRLKPPGNAEITARTSRLLTQASIADSSDADSWVPVSASSGPITIKGCISLSPVASRRSQLMSLGLQPIPNEHGANVLYEEVNKTFSNSSFGIVEEGDDKDGQGGGNAETKAKLCKGVERWPMFYFQILLGGSTRTVGMDDIMNDPRTDLASILDLLKAVCYGFLKKEHFRPRKVHMSAGPSPFSTSRTTGRSRKISKEDISSSSSTRTSSRNSILELRPTRGESPFDGWNRIKVGLPTRTAFHAKEVEKQSSASSTDAPIRLVGEGGKLIRKPFEDASTTMAVESGMTDVREAGLQSSLSKFAAAFNATADNTTKSPNSDDPTQVVSKPGAVEAGSQTQPSEWLEGVIRSWKNPVFETTQSAIPQLYDESAPGSNLHQCSQHSGVNFDTKSMSLNGRVSRAALSKAEVISQVDRKFILVKLPLEGTGREDEASSALIILDQHAADERCRLEDLMANYFEDGAIHIKAVIEPLEQPLLIELSSKEGELLRQYQSYFEAWGVRFELQQVGLGREVPVCKVKATGLPPGILERCRTDPRLLIELIRKEIWALEDGSTLPTRPRSGDSATARFHGCPRGILELLHSRSCRSAIMFNDELSQEECVQLVRRLARCAFPFQCAHGRPSMVPLVDLGFFGEEDDMAAKERRKRYFSVPATDLKGTRQGGVK